MSESTGGSAEDRIAAVMVDHYPVFDVHGHINGTVPGRGAWECWCDLVHSTTEDEVRTHVAGEIAKALQFTEELRVARYTDGIRSVAIPLDSVTSDVETLLNCYRGSVLEARSVSPWVEVVDA